MTQSSNDLTKNQSSQPKSPHQALISLGNHWLWIGLGIALGVRLWFSTISYAFYTDITSFMTWGNYIAEHGVDHFYDRVGCDYPPLYLYILGILATLAHDLRTWSEGHQGLWLQWFHSYPNLYVIDLFCLKLPANLADIAAAWLLGKLLLAKSWFGQNQSRENQQISHHLVRYAVLIYAFNPTLLLNSALWGQVDSILNLILLGVMWCLWQRRFWWAVVGCGLAVLFKPQGLFLLPIVFYAELTKRPWWHWFVAIPFGLGIIWTITVPFLWSKTVALWSNQNLESLSSNLFHNLFPNILQTLWQPFNFLIDRFKGTIDLYPYGSVNAFNWWMFINWKPDNVKIWYNFTYHDLGLFLLISATVWLGIFLFRLRSELTIHWARYVAMAVMYVGIFVLPTRIHERYVLYSLPFLLIIAVVGSLSQKQTLGRYLWWIYGGITFTSLWNLAVILDQYTEPHYVDQIKKVMPLWLQHFPIVFQQVCILVNSLAFCGLIIYSYRMVIIAKERTQSEITPQ